MWCAWNNGNLKGTRATVKTQEKENSPAHSGDRAVTKHGVGEMANTEIVDGAKNAAARQNLRRVKTLDSFFLDSKNVYRIAPLLNDGNHELARHVRSRHEIDVVIRHRSRVVVEDYPSIKMSDPVHFDLKIILLGDAGNLE